MLREALFRLSQEPHLRDVATGNRLARKMASRFVAGETLQEAIASVQELNSQGMPATLDHLGENVSSVQESREATDAACQILRTIARSEIDCNVSLKLTQLGLDLGAETARANLDAVVETAAKSNNFVRIDMESSDYVQRTLDTFYQTFTVRQNVGVVLQAYLYRTGDDLERLIQLGARVRLVKGAYLEPRSVAYPQKSDVDRNFARLMESMLERAVYPAIATHDPHLIEHAKRFARDHQIEPSRFEFQMLYGVRRDLQLGLVKQGYNVRIYVPYGTQWYPYLMRRMAERPANVMFVLANVLREASSPNSS
ncbi:MAG: proline dehydrogenase family protein [Chloroflexota bacterium]